MPCGTRPYGRRGAWLAPRGRGLQGSAPMSALGERFLSTSGRAISFPAPTSLFPPEVRLHFRLTQILATMPLPGRFARSLLRSAARPGPAPRGIVSGPPQHPLGTAVSSGAGSGRG